MSAVHALETNETSAVTGSPSASTERMIELVSKRLRLLGQPTRIRLIEILSRQAMTVQELADAVGGGQQNISQHLALLHEAGVLSRCRKGTHVWYALNDRHVLRLLSEAHASVMRQVGELAQLIDVHEDAEED